MSSDYEVGYGKPPKGTQWKKGHSGNAKGRPKGAKNLETVVRNEAYAKITIKEGGKSRIITKVEALMKSMMAKAIQGNPQAANIALTLLRDHLPHSDPEVGQSQPLTSEELEILSNHAEFLAVLEGVKDDEGGA